MKRCAKGGKRREKEGKGEVGRGKDCRRKVEGYQGRGRGCRGTVDSECASCRRIRPKASTRRDHYVGGK